MHAARPAALFVIFFYIYFFKVRNLKFDYSWKRHCPIPSPLFSLSLLLPLSSPRPDWRLEIYFSTLPCQTNQIWDRDGSKEIYIYIFKYIWKKGGSDAVSPPPLPSSTSLPPSTEMRRVIVFDTAADGTNTRFENRCLRRYDVTRSRSNLVTLRFTQVVMAEWGDTWWRAGGGGNQPWKCNCRKRRLLIHPIHPSTFTLVFLPGWHALH